jgi:hypothetical protein
MPVAPAVIPAARRRQVPLAALLAVLAGGFVWGLVMFAAGRGSVPPPVPSHDEAAHLSYLNRVDQALAKRDAEGARQLLAQPTLAEDQTSLAALALRRTALAALDDHLRAEAAARTTAAWIARLERHLVRLATAPPPAAVVPAPTTGPAPTPPPVLPPGLTYIPDPTEPRQPLEAQRLDGEPFVPVARIADPTTAKRHYALHPTRGLLRSDDDGVTWRAGLGALAELKGPALRFSPGEHPVLLVLGVEVWSFADEDGVPGFFPNR